MFGRFVKRQIRKGARKVLPAPLNKFPGPVGYPHTALKKMVEEVDKLGNPPQERK